MQLFCVVGRTEQLALAELDAVFSTMPEPWTVTILPSGVALLNPSKDGVSLDTDGLEWLNGVQDRLGGTTRMGVVLGSGPYLGELLEKCLLDIAGERKRVEYALSGYGCGNVANTIGVELKRSLKSMNVSARHIRNLKNDTSTVQVWHEKLAAARSQEGLNSHKAEMCFWKDNGQWVVGRTLTVQNIESYSARDFGIPRPNAYNGMVPPKLAQMLVNVAVGYGSDGVAVYDPFCGSGRIVSEAWLMGIEAWGSDRNPKIVEDSKQNIAWVQDTYPTSKNIHSAVWVEDALNVQGNEQIKEHLDTSAIDRWYVVSEPYLGKPLRNPLKQNDTEAWLADVLPLYEGFLSAWTSDSLLRAGIDRRPSMVALVFPAARIESKGEEYVSVYASLVDRLPSLGYSFKQLFRYGRPSALIQREIVLFTYDGSK